MKGMAASIAFRASMGVAAVLMNSLPTPQDQSPS